MPVKQSADFVRKAKDVYERSLRNQLESAHFGDFVTIEPVSADHFLGKTVLDAAIQCLKAYPDRQSFTIRIGFPAAYEIGAASP